MLKEHCMTHVVIPSATVGVTCLSLWFQWFPHAGGPPPVGCLPLLIQYIRSYPPYLEAVSFIRNLRMSHAAHAAKIHLTLSLWSKPKQKT
jgi:hypothetical protein